MTGKIIGIIAFCFVMALVLQMCDTAGSYADVAAEQLNAKNVLKKYEWFKDAAAQLDKKKADISSTETRISELKKELGPRSTWQKIDKEQVDMLETERDGIKASYNLLSAQYNANMAKINYRFANAGDVPAGSEALPREYREYINN